MKEWPQNDTTFPCRSHVNPIICDPQPCQTVNHVMSSVCLPYLSVWPKSRHLSSRSLTPASRPIPSLISHTLTHRQPNQVSPVLPVHPTNQPASRLPLPPFFFFPFPLILTRKTSTYNTHIQPSSMGHLSHLLLSCCYLHEPSLVSLSMSLFLHVIYAISPSLLFAFARFSLFDLLITMPLDSFFFASIGLHKHLSIYLRVVSFPSFPSFSLVLSLSRSSLSLSVRVSVSLFLLSSLFSHHLPFQNISFPRVFWHFSSFTQ